jgi:molybdenum cofactor cytidylyltransferase
VIVNDEWEKGLGSSISSAVNFFEKENYKFDGIMIALGDQPLISIDHFNTLIKKFIEERHSIIATGYSKKLGVPALFSMDYADELKNLGKDHGAQTIIQKYSREVARIQLDSETLDIDIPGGYKEAFRKFGQV